MSDVWTRGLDYHPAQCASPALVRAILDLSVLATLDVCPACGAHLEPDEVEHDRPPTGRWSAWSTPCYSGQAVVLSRSFDRLVIGFAAAGLNYRLDDGLVEECRARLAVPSG